MPETDRYRDAVSYSYNENNAVSGTLASRPGRLLSINLTGAGSGSLTLYDSTVAGTGDVIGIFTSLALPASYDLYGVEFENGLSLIKTAGTLDLIITYQ